MGAVKTIKERRQRLWNKGFQHVMGWLRKVWGEGDIGAKDGRRWASHVNRWKWRFQRKRLIQRQAWERTFQMVSLMWSEQVGHGKQWEKINWAGHSGRNNGHALCHCNYFRFHMESEVKTGRILKQNTQLLKLRHYVWYMITIHISVHNVIFQHMHTF